MQGRVIILGMVIYENITGENAGYAAKEKGRRASGG
jgi:hypothetical protein